MHYVLASIVSSPFYMRSSRALHSPDAIMPVSICRHSIAWCQPSPDNGRRVCCYIITRSSVYVCTCTIMLTHMRHVYACVHCVVCVCVHATVHVYAHTHCCIYGLRLLLHALPLHCVPHGDLFVFLCFTAARTHWPPVVWAGAAMRCHIPEGTGPRHSIIRP